MIVAAHEFGCRIEAERGQRLTGCDVDEVRELLRHQAWVYFSGFDATLEDFDRFASMFGRSAPPRRMPENPGPVALGFHAEDSYNPWRPDALWFLCLAVGSDGGSPTDVLDCVQLLEKMDDRWREFALQNTLRYTQTWPAEEWHQALALGDLSQVEAFLQSLPGMSYEFPSDGSLRSSYEVPMAVDTQDGQRSFSNTMLHAMVQPDFYGQTLGDGSPIPEEFKDHVEKLCLENLVPVGWSEGDVAVIDNYRLMHRRGVYMGVGRDVRVIHGEEFFGTPMPDTSTPVAAKMKEVLQGELGLR
jgi:TfdA family taurine catabolism dioxygenase TauD